MPTERWTVGDVSITKVVETEAWLPVEYLDEILPMSSRAEVEALPWLHPDYVRDGETRMGIYSFLIETPQTKVVVDTGVGNSKRRTRDSWNMLDTGSSTLFGRSGIQPTSTAWSVLTCTLTTLDGIPN
jgi:hypothetical protein